MNTGILPTAGPVDSVWPQADRPGAASPPERPTKLVPRARVWCGTAYTETELLVGVRCWERVGGPRAAGRPRRMGQQGRPILCARGRSGAGLGVVSECMGLCHWQWHPCTTFAIYFQMKLRGEAWAHNYTLLPFISNSQAQYQNCHQEKSKSTAWVIGSCIWKKIMNDGLGRSGAGSP